MHLFEEVNISELNLPFHNEGFWEEFLLRWFLDDVWLDSHSAKSRHVVKFSSASLPICFFFAFKRLIVPKSLALNFYKQLWIAIWKLSIDDWNGPNPKWEN